MTAIATENHPTGLGVYLRTLRGNPITMAERLVDHGIKHASILAAWHDFDSQRIRNQVNAPRFVEVLKRAGIRVSLWGFPRPDMIPEYFGHLDTVTRACGGGTNKCGPISGWLHDPELPWKLKGARKISRTMRGQGEAVNGEGVFNTMEDMEMAAEIFMQTDALSRQYSGVPDVGITSYGMADWHPIPYEIFARYGWSSPQLYSVSPAMVHRGLKSWADRGSSVLIPSVPVFGKNSGRQLLAHLRAFVNPEAPARIDGMMIWSYPQLDAYELKVLRSFSERQGWS